MDLVVDLANSGCELEESLRADPTERRSESELFRRPGDPLYMCSWKKWVFSTVQDTNTNTNNKDNDYMKLV